jgi:hypothetical protein
MSTVKEAAGGVARGVEVEAGVVSVVHDVESEAGVITAACDTRVEVIAIGEGGGGSSTSAMQTVEPSGGVV